MGRRLAFGDVHGNLRALEQVFERAKVTSQDKLIFLGDVADGWPDVKGCIEFLIQLGNQLIKLRGNHCDWFDDWAQGRTHAMVEPLWYRQGGEATLNSYGLGRHLKANPNNYFGPFMCAQQDKIPETHLKYLSGMLPYYIEDRILFVHGGCGYPFRHPSKIGVQDLIWDRDMWMVALHEGDVETKDFDEIYIGHTTTSRIAPDLKPVNRGKVWNLDQGAGWEGRLTMMDVDTKEYWQSDLAQDLYPGVKGRG